MAARPPGLKTQEIPLRAAARQRQKLRAAGEEKNKNAQKYSFFFDFLMLPERTYIAVQEPNSSAHAHTQQCSTRVLKYIEN